jgi:hypothetical protein
MFTFNNLQPIYKRFIDRIGEIGPLMCLNEKGWGV